LELKFCSQCGAPVTLTVPNGDHLPRHICDECGIVHYQNPKLVVGVVPEYRGQILLCKRAIEPRLGFWTMPAGFMENGETMQQAAARESMEEAMAHVEVGSLLAVVSVTHAHQVHVMFRGKLNEPKFGAGAESLEVMLCDEAQVPWPDIAFPSVEFALRKYFSDRAIGRDDHHFHEINRQLRKS
jgi:ADP-ribose pyrophosphatase YjhB (NUDIX family)